MPLAPRWRLLDSGAADGATNMATDVALMARAAATGEAVLRIYAWSAPTISFGIHERARLTSLDLSKLGYGAVRRPTGGRALLHHHEVTYSVTAPLRDASFHDASLAESYRAINRILLRALERLGVQAEPATRTARATSPTGAACFAEPNEGELVVEGRKLIGSAQRRDAHALLQHGSILLEDDQGVLGGTQSASLNALLGRRVAYAEVRNALVDALGDAEPRDAPPEPLDPAALAAAIRAERPRFEDPLWTFRR